MTVPIGRGFEILLASPPEYEYLVAEISFNGDFVAQLNREKGIDFIEIEFPDLDVDQTMICRTVDLDGFLKAVAEAYQKLLG
ncbi:MAG: hypothetical protein AAFR38_04680 [Planctomycetota bacterium]